MRRPIMRPPIMRPPIMRPPIMRRPIMRRSIMWRRGKGDREGVLVWAAQSGSSAARACTCAGLQVQAKAASRRAALGGEPYGLPSTCTYMRTSACMHRHAGERCASSLHTNDTTCTHVCADVYACVYMIWVCRAKLRLT